MKNFELYNLDTAPEAAKPLFEKSLKGFGMIPNLHAVMAESPALLEAYQGLHVLAQNASFDNEELTGTFSQTVSQLLLVSKLWGIIVSTASRVPCNKKHRVYRGIQKVA